MEFKNTQISYLPLVFLFLFALLLVFFDVFVALLCFAIGVLIIFCFSSLNTTIADQTLEVKFGIFPIFHKRFPINQILSCQVVEDRTLKLGVFKVLGNKGYTLFKLWGFQTVEIILLDGKTYRIGTNKPKELEEAIKKKMSIIPGQ